MQGISITPWRNIRGGLPDSCDIAAEDLGLWREQRDVVEQNEIMFAIEHPSPAKDNSPILHRVRTPGSLPHTSRA